MDKTVKEMIAEIKKASECENLVVFIGAGVSVNSGYKLWDSLVGLFNEELKFSTKTKNYSTDEMLKIPQYFYNEDSDKYKKIVKDEYGKLPEKTNAIIDEILNLNPLHIITTNFDVLIEKSLEENYIFGNTVYGSLGKYSIIRSDDDFVNATKNHYLVKMHGDVNSMDSLVLKEDDYLQYSSSHILIETFIKSLFVNHTVLFIGYGLGDYNIKLIMSWVSGIIQNQKQFEPNNRFTYYFINAESEPLKGYEKDYYKKKNISVLDISGVPENFNPPKHNENNFEFEDDRGNNLLRICKYIKYGKDNDLAEIKKDLSVFDSIDCITIKELMFKLGDYAFLYNVYDNVLNYRTDLISHKFKTIINMLFNEGTEFDYFSLIFKKAGIDSIVHESSKPEYKTITFLDDSQKSGNKLYESIIECNIKKIYKIAQGSCDDKRAMLQAGYAYSILGDIEKAITLLDKAKSQYSYRNDFFHLLICYYDIFQLDDKEAVWYRFKNSLSEDDKKTFITLYDYLDNSDEIYQETVETFKSLERKFDANYHRIDRDENNLKFLKLRYRIHQTQRYFIQNSIYIKGYSGFTSIIGNWLKSLDLYVELILMLHSSNVKMKRERIKYERNPLKIEDLYILITQPNNDDLKYLLDKYSVKQIIVSEKCTDFIISVLNNYIDAFEYKKIIDFKLVAEIKNVLTLIQIISFKPEHYTCMFQCFTELFIKIITTNFDKRDIYFTVLRDVPSEILEVIFSILKYKKDTLKDDLLKTFIENMLQTFINCSEEENLSVTIFKECSVLQNFNIALNYYYKDTISERISEQFFVTIQNYHPNLLGMFIIELFPILKETQKNKWRKFVSLLSIEPVYIQFGIINGVFIYNDKICAKLVSLCKQQVKEKASKKNENLHLKPLYTIFRLVEKGYITNLEPYKEFKGHYNLFDFVCFPNEFDYTKYETTWGSWLTLEKYREAAFNKNYDTLREKYKHAIEDGASDEEKSIYYKYFYFEDEKYYNK